MTEKTLATFRTNLDRWNAFKEKAKANNVNASTLLNQFVESYLLDVHLDKFIDVRLDNDVDTRLDNIDKHLDKRIDDRIDNVLSSIRSQMDELKAELGKFAA